MANSVDPEQTAPIGAVCSGSTLFASILNLSDDFSRRQFQMHFFLHFKGENWWVRIFLQFSV